MKLVAFWIAILFPLSAFAGLTPNACVDENGKVVACEAGKLPTVCTSSNNTIISCETEETEETEEQGFEYWVNLMVQIFVPIAAAVLGAFASNYKKKNDYKPRRVKKGHRKNTVLQIGVGRSGKTKLVEALAKPLGDGTTEVTNDFNIHSFSSIDEDGVVIDYDITDYRGQDFSQLVSNFIKEQLKPGTKLRYGDINSLVIVVDLFSFKSEDDSRQSSGKLDLQRISDQINEWNRTALDAVFGLLTKESLNYVCLFINKADKWSVALSDGEKAEKAKEAYQKLIDDLKSRAKNTNKHSPKDNVTFEVIVGSTLKGNGTVGSEGLMSSLAKHSIPMKKA